MISGYFLLLSVVLDNSCGC